jgi:hypothetical protein
MPKTDIITAAESSVLQQSRELLHTNKTMHQSKCLYQAITQILQLNMTGKSTAKNAQLKIM